MKWGKFCVGKLKWKLFDKWIVKFYEDTADDSVHKGRSEGSETKRRPDTTYVAWGASLRSETNILMQKNTYKTNFQRHVGNNGRNVNRRL